MSGRETTVSTYLDVTEGFRLRRQEEERIAESLRILKLEADKLAVIGLARQIIGSGETAQS